MSRRSLLVPIVLLLGIGVGWFLKSSMPQKEVAEQPNKVLKEEVNDYSVYEPTFKRDGQVFLGKPLSEDLTGDDQPELIFITYGEGCASCHAQNIYIFQNKKELLKLESNDPFFHTLPRRGFLIVEPLGEENEGTCCPTAYQNTLYLWDGEVFRKK